MQPPGVHLGPVASVLLAATFGPDGRPGTRDAAWAGVFGDDPDPWGRLTPDDRETVTLALDEALAGHLVTHQFVSAPRAGDEPLPVLLHFVPVRLAGDPRPTAVTVTGEVLAEPSSWALAQTRRHRLEALGRMTMGIAHDFNNLLASVLGHAELLRELPAFTAAGDEVTGHVGTMERAALDGAALIGKIQRFLRQEKEERYAPVDLADLARDAVALTRPYWFNEPRRRGIAIDVTTGGAPVPPVLGSATELREVLVNLLLNAVQAMPDGGAITLTTRHDDARDQSCLTVTDTGTGMTPDVKARIFEPMFSTKGEAGNGMGLAVTYGIIQAHDGKVHVESAPGEGTTFTLAFPVAVGAAEVAETVGAAPAERKNARVLVVDDEPLVRTVLARLLKLRGHEVVQAASGPEALVLAAEQPFDVLVTDLGMPGMNGRALAAAFRSHHAGVPVVLLTGDTEAGEADAAIDVVLAKPFRADDVEATIQRVLAA